MLIDRGPFHRRVLKNYISQMSKPNPRVIFDDFVAEILDQQGFSWEEEPRSVFDPQQLYDALERYATEWSEFEFLDEHLTYGFKKAFKIFAKPKDADCLQPLKDDEVASKALKLSKSSGLPLMVKKSDALSYSFDREGQVRAGIKAANPCIAYKRTQKGGKTRLVWGYPLEMTIMEARFARPLIDTFSRMRTPMAFGMSKCELGARIHRYVVDAPGKVVALDYSKFDTTISATMINQAFRILSTWFSKEDRLRLGWKTIGKYFVTTPIVMPNGHLYTGKRHGVPSGSYFTQMIDSIVNVALMYALAHRFNFRFNAESLLVLGDDVIVNVNGPVSLERWSQFLKSRGMILNVQKTMLDEPHFLGAFWYKGKPDAPIQELVNKAVFPENFRLYGTTPHAGAESVLRSYASNYLSAIRLLPTGFRLVMRNLDLPDSTESIKPEHLSGSDRYLLEESKLARSGKLDVGIPSLSSRILS